MALRGKKSKGLTAFSETYTEEDGGYLIEDGESKRWNPRAVPMVARAPKVDKVPEDEVQEVSIEMKEDSPQLGEYFASLFLDKKTFVYSYKLEINSSIFCMHNACTIEL